MPDVLIQDHERGIQHDLHQQSYTSGGQTVYTLSTVRKVDETSPPEAKDLVWLTQFNYPALGMHVHIEHDLHVVKQIIYLERTIGHCIIVHS